MNEETKNNMGMSTGSEKEHSILPTTSGKRSKVKKILLILLAVVIVVSGAAGISFANKMKKLRDGGPLMFMLEKVTKDLNLTDGQKTQVQSIKDEIKTKMESRKEDRKNNAAEFENAFKQDKLDKETLKSLYQKHEANREEMKEFFMDELIKFHDVLTPDQRTKVVDEIHTMKEKHDSWKHENKPENN